MSLLFVDDEPENVQLAAEILADALGQPVKVVDSVEAAVEALHTDEWKLVIMDLFIPLGAHPDRVLGPRARRYQDQVDHLGGLVLLEEIDRIDEDDRPVVISHTACTDHVLLELFGDRVARRLPKPSPMDTLLHNVMEVLDDIRRENNPFG
ncbi:MAG: response regulator [Deltaproteobacteria bacterium]|nr:MAG: response regulator [Deltaproteobacteria bacterium]